MSRPANREMLTENGTPVKIMYHTTFYYQTDPEFRERYKKITSEWLKNKCASDPEYHEQRNQRRREAHKQRYENDPEYREKILAYNRAKRAEYKKKAEAEKAN